MSENVLVPVDGLVRIIEIIITLKFV